MVDENGKVSAKKAGSATITVTTADGGKTDTCTVDVIPDSLPDHVDLGLSVKWRSYNLGASSPEETGLFYQWGDTKGYGSDTSDGKYFHWADSSGRISYKWCYRIDGAEPILAKYNTKTKCGIVDNRNTLEMKDDAARVALGGEWRIPTRREWENLWECCSWTWTTFNGVEGYRVQSRREGYTDNWIFLPVTGHRYKNKKSRDFGSYWSSSLSPNEYMMHVNEYIEYVPQELSFGPGDFRIKDGARHWGYAIRPILD